MSGTQEKILDSNLPIEYGILSLWKIQFGLKKTSAPITYRMLVIKQGWDATRYESWLTDLLIELCYSLPVGDVENRGDITMTFCERTKERKILVCRQRKIIRRATPWQRGS